MSAMTAEDAALLRLLGLLDAQGYDFVAPTPATHARVIARRGDGEARGLRDALGWSLPFRAGTLGPAIEAALAEAGMLEPGAGCPDEGQGIGRPKHDPADALTSVRATSSASSLQRSRVRVSRVHGRLHLHSAFPTDAADAVFLGPDSYRFADLIAAELAAGPAAPGRIVDIGTGAGVGAIIAAAACPDADVVMTDINPAALRLARINAAHAGLRVTAAEGGGLGLIGGAFDLALTNPPFIVDPAARAYRHGGDMHGGALSLDLAREAMGRLGPGGRLILYTGSAIVDGQDLLRAALDNAAQHRGCAMRYCEIDPDVFGEELETEAYGGVDRIAIVAGIFTRLGATA